ncbi:hypothetical protein V5O48_016534 [Marasmius crinis-equi]|uniref:Uncharacterized protein n=1 Tax=Marasmius crinis-equi TaxID=585013 RepID=A0ABR3ERI1_9AGAR
MARQMTKPTQKEMAERRKVSAKLASKEYRAKNRDEYNRKARERMAIRREKLRNEDPDKLKASEQAHSHSYYHTNRQRVLDKAEAKRYRDYRECHGEDSFDRNYRFRDVRPRELLDLKVTDPMAYEEAVKNWQERKRAHRLLEEWHSTDNPSMRLMKAVMDLNQSA